MNYIFETTFFYITNVVRWVADLLKNITTSQNIAILK